MKMMKRLIKKSVVLMAAVSIATVSIASNNVSTVDAKKVNMVKKNITLKVGKNYKLKLGKIKAWTSTYSGVAYVVNGGIKAKKVGKTKITVTKKYKKYVYNVTVKPVVTANKAAEHTPAPTQTPADKPTILPTPQPTTTSMPVVTPTVAPHPITLSCETYFSDNYVVMSFEDNNDCGADVKSVTINCEVTDGKTTKNISRTFKCVKMQKYCIDFFFAQARKNKENFICNYSYEFNTADINGMYVKAETPEVYAEENSLGYTFHAKKPYGRAIGGQYYISFYDKNNVMVAHHIVGWMAGTHRNKDEVVSFVPRPRYTTIIGDEEVTLDYEIDRYEISEKGYFIEEL